MQVGRAFATDLLLVLPLLLFSQPLSGSLESSSLRNIST
jgi:hypothetical protein